MYAILLALTCVSFDNQGCVAWEANYAGGHYYWEGPTASLHCETERMRRELKPIPMVTYECRSGSVQVEFEQTHYNPLS